MTKLTMGKAAETPTERVVNAAKQAETITDVQGRVLTVRKLDALDKFRLFKALGQQHSNNSPVLGYAMLMAHVTAIDGKPMQPPLTERVIEANIAQLGDDGLEAVAKFMEESVGGSPKGAAAEG